MSEELRLLEAWRAGDDAAGQALFEQLFPACRRFFVNKVPQHDLEDLLQQTFAALVASRDRFRGESSFKSFALGVARITLFRYLRAFARRDAKHTPELHESSIEALGVTPGSVIASAQEHEAVRLALQRIPVHFQTILELSYWEGMTNDELAEIFEIDRTTVRTRLFRARKALARALEGPLASDEASLDRAARGLGKQI